jgi:NAD(P)-dependent dehydrogenase (short-subunit alcohol dehydrogenase family)
VLVAIGSDFSGKVVLITGGAGGVGKACGARFVEAGAQVFLADINEALLEEAVADLRRVGPPVAGIPTDVRKVADCERMVNTVAEQAGRLDVLVNAAGVWVEGPAVEMTEADWDRTIDVNLKGTFFACRSAIPELQKTEGSIVNLSSDSGVVGSPDTSVYVASKGGVSLMTKALALELAPHLVNVNAICPSDIMSPMLEGQARDYGGGDREGYFKRLLTCYAQGDKARFIQPEEIAELVFYLASPAAAPMTGSLVSIDFGTTAGYGYGESLPASSEGATTGPAMTRT